MKLLLKSIWPAVLLGLIAAILFNLAFPGGPFPWLAWVAMVPVMILMLKSDRPWLICLGWGVYGVLFWLGAVYWLYFFMRFVLEFHVGVAVLLLFLCILMSAFPYLLFGYFGGGFRLLNGRWGALKVATLLSSLVALWPVPFPGDLSMSFYRTPIFAQIADIGGGHCIHFVIIWVNALIAQGLASLLQKQSVPRTVWMNLLAIFLFVVGYGYFKLNEYERLYEETPISQFVRIGYVQPNIPGHDLSGIFGNYFPSGVEENDFMTTVEMTRRLVEKERGLDLVAWPETPEDFPYNHFDSVREAIADIVKKGRGVPFIFDSMHPWTGISDKLYTTGRNSIYLVKDGELSYPYQKANLIPFSEYLPWEERFPILREWFPLVGDVVAGDLREPIGIGERLRIIPLICYDGIFPEFVRRFSLNGGNVLLSLDNDTNFGPTKASAAHAAAMLYRAIENRMPLIRLSNVGESFTVLSSGEILSGSEIAMYKKDFRAVTILPGLGKRTIYQLGGHSFPYIILGVFLGIYLIDWLRIRIRIH